MKKAPFIPTEDQKFLTDVLAEFALGHHHLPDVRGWGDGIVISWSGNLATYDFDGLTRLVILAHKHAVRIEIGSGGPRMANIIAHRRKHGPFRELSQFKRHPNLDELRLAAQSPEFAV